VWITIAAVCIALTVYEIPNARLIWRYALMVSRGFHALESEKDVKSKLPNDLVAADPEAADILAYCLAEPNDEDLAEMVAKYPENEFFLAQLAERLTEANLVDPRAALALADRLISLAPDNAHYRYMKGWILLSQPWRPQRRRDALEQFELGNALPRFYLAHSKYKQRVDPLCDKAGLGPITRSRATPGGTKIYRELANNIRSWYGPYSKLDAKLADDLSTAVAEIGSRLVNHAQDARGLESGAFLLGEAERARLRRLNLSESEAQQARFRLSQAIEMQVLAGRRFDEISSVVFGLAKPLLVAVIPLLVLSALPLAWLFVVIVNCVRGWAKHARVGAKAYILFVVALGGILGLLALLGLLDERFGMTSFWALAFVGSALTVWVLLWLLARLRPVDHTRFRRARRRAAIICGPLWTAGTVLWAVHSSSVFASADMGRWTKFLGVLLGWSAFCVVIWAVTAYRYHVFRVVAYDRLLRNRFVQLVLLILLMTGITGLVQPIPLAPTISLFSTVLLAALLATHAPRGRLIFVDGLRRFFRKEGEIVLTRTRIARIMSMLLVLCWLPILAAIHISAAKFRRLDMTLTDPLSLYRPLPQATQETYERVLSGKNTVEADAKPPRKMRWESEPWKPLYVAQPEDISALIAEREVSGTPLSDRKLLWLLEICGHDVRPIILEALTDPNAEEVLIIRAKWGDRSVKPELERIFEEKMAELTKTIAEAETARQTKSQLRVLLRVADALAHISGPSEAKERFSRLLEPVQEYALDQFLPLSPVAAGQEAYVLPSERELLGRLVQYEGNTEVTARRPLKDPNAIDVKAWHAIDVLITKAQSGDTAVKEKLEEVFESRLDELPRNLSRQESERELLASVLHIAGALSFVSEPQEAKDRFSRFMEPLIEATRRSQKPPAERAFLSSLYDRDYEILFYRSLEGLPKPNATTLFNDYVQQVGLANLLEGSEFPDVLGRLADRELAERVFNAVAASPPTEDSYDIPVGEPFDIFNLEETKRPRDVSHKFLEAIFAQLGEESMPLLLQYLNSDQDQLRAFVVWCVTALEYEWSAEQMRALRKDPFWKVRLNALFARDAEELGTALDDENGVVRVVAKVLSQAHQ
jgi:hypothetical protein